MSARSQGTADGGPRFHSWIDAPENGHSSLTHFVVRGWCYRDDGEPIVEVRARIRNRTCPGIYGDARPDVHAARGGARGSAHSGFEIPVAVASAHPDGVLEARDATGRWDEFGGFTIETSTADALTATVVWARFWVSAWAGYTNVWSGLTEPERDYAVAVTRVRGWFTLDPQPQYAPRPLPAETFPSWTRDAANVPRLTVVTPSYQQARFLDAAMRSVLDQPGVAIEYVVQDGGSTDGSVEIIRSLADRLASWESAPDAGQADAIARGFARVTAGADDVMMFLNSDDLMLPGAARFILEYFGRHPEVDVVYGHRILIDEDGGDVGRWITPRAPANDLRMHDLVPQETLFWRRRIWDRVGGLDTSFHYALDWDLLLRFIDAGARIVRLPWSMVSRRVPAARRTEDPGARERSGHSRNRTITAADARPPRDPRRTAPGDAACATGQCALPCAAETRLARLSRHVR
jgi:GT2 family glycosyltransferase